MIKTRAERFSAPRLNCYARSKVSPYPCMLYHAVRRAQRRPHKRPFTDADIWMKNKEKAPFSRGAYYIVRNPQERVPLTQLFAK